MPRGPWTTYIHRAALVSTDAGIGDHAIGRPRPGLLGQSGWVEARQDHEIERRFIPYCAVRIHRVPLHLRATSGRILDPNDLSLLGTRQEHEAIIRWRRHSGVVVGPRRANQERRQDQPKKSTTLVAGVVPESAYPHIAESSRQMSLFSLERSRFKLDRLHAHTDDRRATRFQ